MFRKSFFTFIICIIIIVFLIIFHHLGWLKSTEGYFLKTFSPVGNFFYNLGRKTHNFFILIGSIKNLEKENLKLQEKVNQLILENIRLKEAERENIILREQLDLVKKSERKLLSAFVIAQDPSGLFQFITINRGEKDKIKPGMPVVVAEGILVGKIKEVSSDTSKVLLITDSSSRIPALIQESQAQGVVKGEMGLGLLMEMIPQDVQIKNGDNVITSSIGGEFPKGLLIGKVEEIERREGELFQKVRVRPACDFKKLELVSVIIN